MFTFTTTTTMVTEFEWTGTTTCAGTADTSTAGAPETYSLGNMVIVNGTLGGITNATQITTDEFDLISITGISGCS
jgi:hydrogenase maturation factor